MEKLRQGPMLHLGVKKDWMMMMMMMMMMTGTWNNVSSGALKLTLQSAIEGDYLSVFCSVSGHIHCCYSRL
jgi:hypothetical protein